MNNQQQPKMNVDLSQTIAVLCESCKSDIFLGTSEARICPNSTCGSTI